MIAHIKLKYGGRNPQPIWPYVIFGMILMIINYIVNK